MVTEIRIVVTSGGLDIDWKRHKETPREIEMFYILNWVEVMWVYT